MAQFEIDKNIKNTLRDNASENSNPASYEFHSTGMGQNTYCLAPSSNSKINGSLKKSSVPRHE